MLLVLWDVDGTLVRTAGHGRYAFEEAFEAVGMTAVLHRGAETTLPELERLLGVGLS